MTQTPDTERIAAERRESANGGAADEGGLGAVPQRAADRLGLSGPEGSRRRGALLRRLLALGDWTALIAALLWSPRRPPPPTSPTSSGRPSSAPAGSSW